jgi:hypothetical protein
MTEDLKAQITIICYRYISSEFAALCNPSNRSAKFKWAAFPPKMGDTVLFWLKVNDIDTSNQAVSAYAKDIGRKLATHLITRAGFIEENV